MRKCLGKKVFVKLSKGMLYRGFCGEMGWWFVVIWVWKGRVGGTHAQMLTSTSAACTVGGRGVVGACYGLHEAEEGHRIVGS